jgi:hypothetical protein
MALAVLSSNGSTAGPERNPIMSGLAATLRETDPGTKVRLEMRDGSEVSGTVADVNGESVSLDGGGVVELRQVRRVVIEFGDKPTQRRSKQRKQAA